METDTVARVKNLPEKLTENKPYLSWKSRDGGRCCLVPSSQLEARTGVGIFPINERKLETKENFELGN